MPDIQPTQQTRPPEAIAALAQLNMGRVLRPLVNLFSAIAFYFYLRVFLSASFVLRYDPDVAYIALLTAYAGHRELRRWSQDPTVIQERARRGELFVVGWWAFYAVTLTAANHVAMYQIPPGLLSLCIQVTTIFFGTLTSQQLYKRKQIAGRAQNGTAMGSLTDRILALAGKRPDPLSLREIETELRVPRATIARAVAALLEQGKVERVSRDENDPDGGIRPKARDTSETVRDTPHLS